MSNDKFDAFVKLCVKNCGEKQENLNTNQYNVSIQIEYAKCVLRQQTRRMSHKEIRRVGFWIVLKFFLPDFFKDRGEWGLSRATRLILVSAPSFESMHRTTACTVCPSMPCRPSAREALGRKWGRIEHQLIVPKEIFLFALESILLIFLGNSTNCVKDLVPNDWDRHKH